MSALVKRFRDSTSVRALAVPTYRVAAKSVFFFPGPRVLANSMPKAGTHLLSALLDALPKMMFSGVHRALNDYSLSPGISPAELPEIDVSRLKRTLRSVNRGHYMTAHFPRHDDLIPLIEEFGYRTVFILRDPRDVAVSGSFYFTGSERHFLNRRFVDKYRSDEERVMASILGFPADEFGPGQESVGERLAKYTPWLERDDVRTCRFEDLVGSRGGGSAEIQLREIQAVARHVSRPLSDEGAVSVAEKIWSPMAATFRTGTIGDWRNHFSPDHVRAFKEVAGDALIALGYERDLDWE